jgi:hypothetical protein
MAGSAILRVIRNVAGVMLVIVALTYGARHLNPFCAPRDTSTWCGRTGLLALLPEFPSRSGP